MASDNATNKGGNENTVLVSIGVALWVSFLYAGVASMLFFSAFDPVVIAQVATFPMELDRRAWYSIGFILFWLLLFTSSMTVAWLVKRPLPNAQKR